jgi:UDP-glucuronate decarboxylase
MSNELSSKDSEKLAKIRKEAKFNKACIYGTNMTEAFLGGTVIGGIANSAVDLVDKTAEKTSEVYGDPECNPQPESYRGRVNTIGPRSCYDEGKRVAETLFFDYHRQHGVDIKVMRIFNTYGPRMDIGDGRVVSNFIVQALRGQDITIYGDGSQTRSFCYVDDLIEGMIRLMNSREGFTGPVNIGNPGEFTIKQLAEMVVELTGTSSKIIYEDLPVDDPTQRKPDITLAKKELNWEPTVALRDGLQKTIDYFKGVI